MHRPFINNLILSLKYLFVGYRIYLLREDSLLDRKKLKISQDNSLSRQGRKRIRCPLCGWVPDSKPYWMCEKCGEMFDTFKARAHCPNLSCGNSWKDTQCIKCLHMMIGMQKMVNKKRVNKYCRSK